MNKDDALSHGNRGPGEHPPLIKNFLLFERRQQPIVPIDVFRSRLIRNSFVAGLMIAVSLLIGMLGYHWTSHDPVTGRTLGWLESLYNASMILTGMGPVDRLESSGAKLFASGYSLFSGVAFLTSVGVLGAPVIHRLMHRFHLGLDEESGNDDQP